jgi:ABC-type branched-subunit amino acid transport system ATPase component
VPRAGAEAAAARRTDRRHGARRHQQHHRPAQADQGKRDITIAIIEHDMHVVFSLAERITVLAQGTPLVEDIPENIKGHPKVQSEAYLGEAHDDARTKTASGRRAPIFRRTPTMAETAPAFLSVWDLHAYYGESYIVQGVSFNVHEGEILALLGRNGAGKTTTLRAIARLDNPQVNHGEIWLDHQAAAQDEKLRGCHQWPVGWCRKIAASFPA